MPIPLARFRLRLATLWRIVIVAMQDSTSTTQPATIGGSAQDELSNATRAARRARINPARMARVLRALRRHAWRAARAAQEKQSGGPREFGPLFLAEFAEEFTSGALGAWSQGAPRAAMTRAGYAESNVLFSKMDTAKQDDSALLSLPAEIVTPDAEEFEHSARLLSETRRAVILRALELRERARAAYDKDREAIARMVGKKTRAENKARREFARDARIIRRAARCALARLKGEPFAFAIARGVSREGRRGGHAPETESAWFRMMRAHDATRARLGLAPLTPEARRLARD